MLLPKLSFFVHCLCLSRALADQHDILPTSLSARGAISARLDAPSDESAGGSYYIDVQLGFTKQNTSTIGNSSSYYTSAYGINTTTSGESVSSIASNSTASASASSSTATSLPDIEIDDTELADQIGQLLVVGFDEPEPNDAIKLLIQKYRVGTVILYNRNVENPQQLLELTWSLQKLAKDAGYERPLVITMDQENGIVNRLPLAGAPFFPGAMAVAAADDPEVIDDVYSTTAKYLRKYNVFWNYSPDADINSNPNNPVIGLRSFGDNPKKVADQVRLAVDVLQENGVIATIKHFPGHGDTGTDSHYNTAFVNKTMEELEECELVPFAKCAGANPVDAIMIAHIVCPALGDDLPATVSSNSYKLLREKLGYDGYVVTDDLEMEAVAKTIGAVKGAEMALIAGADSIMMSQLPERQVGAFIAMYKAVQARKVPRSQIIRSIERFDALRDKYLPSWDELLKPKTLDDVFSAGELEADRKRMDSYHDKIITAIRGEEKDYLINEGEHVILAYSNNSDALQRSKVIGYDRATTQFISPDVIDELQKYPVEAELIMFTANDDPSKYEDQIRKADKVIVLALRAQGDNGQLNFIKYASAIDSKKLITVATYGPYDFLPKKWETIVPNYFATFGPSTPAFKALLKILFGKQKAVGKLPVSSTM